jgi:hypothetical protein
MNPIRHAVQDLHSQVCEARQVLDCICNHPVLELTKPISLHKQFVFRLNDRITISGLQHQPTSYLIVGDRKEPYIMEAEKVEEIYPSHVPMASKGWNYSSDVSIGKEASLACAAFEDGRSWLKQINQLSSNARPLDPVRWMRACVGDLRFASSKKGPDRVIALNAGGKKTLVCVQRSEVKHPEVEVEPQTFLPETDVLMAPDTALPMRSAFESPEQEEKGGEEDEYADEEVKEQNLDASQSWFEQMFGFEESSEDSMDDVRAHFTYSAKTRRITSLDNGKSFAVGSFNTPTVFELETLAARGIARLGTYVRSTLSVVYGDVADLQKMPENNGAVFQVQSQFNCLQLAGSDSRPEDGVTEYAQSNEQGARASVSAGAAALFRNYFYAWKVDGDIGQSSDRMIDNLVSIRQLLQSDLFSSEAGFTFATAKQMKDVNEMLDEFPEGRVGQRLRLGVHSNVQVGNDREQLITQVLASACTWSERYDEATYKDWQRFGQTIAQSAYVGTLAMGVVNHCNNPNRVGSTKVILTVLPGPEAWVADAIWMALSLFWDAGLEVVINLNKKEDCPELLKLVEDWSK